jgi:hypothetical protein
MNGTKVNTKKWQLILAFCLDGTSNKLFGNRFLILFT